MNPQMSTPETERYPTLTEHGRRMLKFLSEHPCAPIYRNQSGNRLTAADVEAVREFEKEVLAAQIDPHHAWLSDFTKRCLEDVPFYRRYDSDPIRFEDIPTISRADLGRDIAQFVPDSVEIDRLINFRTSGTTGHSLLLASHPVVAAGYLAFHKKALRRFGIELGYGHGQVGVVLVGFQRKCFTYVSVTPTMDESGLAKINLHPDDWRRPEDRAEYIDALAAEVYTGDPISLAELATLPLKTRPRAVLSTSMMLSQGLRKRLEEVFGCPVLDLYSLNEAGPVAVADERCGGHVLLQHRMFVEILDSYGRALPSGQRGEVTLTGGFNFCLPLLRYRTGDYASLETRGGEPVLIGLSGRPPIRFRTVLGEWINNIEVTHALRRFVIPQFTLHQRSNGSLLMRGIGLDREPVEIRSALLELFGPAQPLDLEDVPNFEGKVIQYTSDLPESQDELGA